MCGYDYTSGAPIFANGAVTGTFLYAFNALSTKLLNAAKGRIRIINKKLAGGIHQKTGVRFSDEGFPIFDDVAEETVKIKMTGVRQTDDALANAQAGLKSTPEGYTWHHVEDGETMQLVPTSIHDKVAHTGGVAVIKALSKISGALSVIAPALNAIDPSYYAERAAYAGCAGGDLAACGTYGVFGGSGNKVIY